MRRRKSATRLARSRDGAGNAVVMLQTQDDIIYQLQSTPALGAPRWSDVGQVFVGSGGGKQVPLAIGDATLFFRVIRGSGT
jgi:hypothetical protein